MEGIGQDRFFAVGVDQALLVIIVGKGFRRGDQHRAEHPALGAERHHRGQVGAVRESSGRQDGHARLLGYCGKEFMQRGVTTDMAAGFDALDDQDLRSGMFHRTRLGERSHLTYDDDLGIAQPLHQRKRHIPKQTHDGDAEFDAR